MSVTDGGLADLAFFDPDPAGGDALVPTDMARSGWGADHVHGVAVSGALAREVERAAAELGRADLRPARYTVDLVRPARMRPGRLTSRVVREGRRIAVIEVALQQDDDVVARASAVLLAPASPGEGRTWSPSERPSPPPLDVAPPSDEPRVPFVHSESGWSQNFTEHQNASRKSTWNSAIPVVRGEPLTPFQAVAATADGASLVTNWGSAGVEYINVDITLALVRDPAGTEIGLHALDRVERDGIAVGTVQVFDREGPLGSIVMTALVNAGRRVDLGATDLSDDGTPQTASA